MIEIVYDLKVDIYPNKGGNQTDQEVRWNGVIKGISETSYKIIDHLDKRKRTEKEKIQKIHKYDKVKILAVQVGFFFFDSEKRKFIIVV